MFSVPQGSILGPILFIIFFSDLFYIYNDLDYASYANDTTPYVCRQNYAETIEFLESTINNIFSWFEKNGLVAKSGKSNFFVRLYEKIILKIQDSTVKSSLCEELLGVTIESELIFHKHIASLCYTANQKLIALARTAKYLTIDKQKIFLNFFITVQLNYCSLIWMYHSRTVSNKIKKI